MLTDKNFQKGFTLIELLVVISIIGLLSSIVLASLNGARHKAEIAKFRADFDQIKKAVVLYQTNNNGNYPSALINHIGMDELASELKSAGVYPADTFTLPPMISYGGITFGMFGNPDGVFGEGTSCGQPDYVNTGFAYYFEIDDETVRSQFPDMYFYGVNFSESDGFVCLEF